MTSNDFKLQKENLFQIWDEFMIILDLASMMNFNDETFLKIKKNQSKKKKNFEIFYERNTEFINLNKLMINIDENVVVSLILKWEELIVASYLLLQIARKMGGTLGFKVCPIWFFHKKEKEKHAESLLCQFLY